MADSPLDALVALMAQQAERFDAMIDKVDALSDTVAQLADRADGASAPSYDVSHIQMTQEQPYAPLVPRNDENEFRRFKLARDLGLIGHPEGQTIIESGGRGYYREYQIAHEDAEREVWPTHKARLLIEDALVECPLEAADMGADLLLVWDDEGVPPPGA